MAKRKKRVKSYKHKRRVWETGEDRNGDIKTASSGRY
jgi:hypothetical protein